MATLVHHSLGATLHGVCRGEHVWQFRGLPYASIPYRFALPEPPAVISGDVDCTKYGPRCPQNYVDFRHLLRIPEDKHVPEVAEDEFECLNLDITRPADLPSGKLAPVLVWIHGGSQAVTFGDSASGLCDPTRLVERSAISGKPIIVVTLSYRLNIFAFGDETSEMNLALRDQRAAIDYIRSHIAGFGGDPERITISGESAGAIYCHAHGLMGAPATQCILQSGTLQLSPPQPRATAQALIRKMEQAVADLGNWTLRTAPVAKILGAQESLGLISFYLQTEDALQGWRDNIGGFERIMIGDCEYESVLWRNGIEGLSASYICEAFDLAGDAPSFLKAIYGIIPDRPVSCKLGALDFLNDARFSWPISEYLDERRADKRPSFRFLVDQPNPWQTSSRAHHGVDLLYIFGGFDFSFDEGAVNVSEMMQVKWIEFVNGEDPWGAEEAFAFGPLGNCQAVDAKGVATRRRERHLSVLRDIGYEKVNAVVVALAAGRSSLLN